MNTAVIYRCRATNYPTAMWAASELETYRANHPGQFDHHYIDYCQECQAWHIYKPEEK